jgi:hypothetical protein
MRIDFRDINVPDAPGNGRILRVGEYRDKTVQVCEAFTGSIDIEVSLSGSHWVKLHTGITAPGIFAIAPTCSDLRIVVTSMTGDPPIARFGGIATRSD